MPRYAIEHARYERNAALIETMLLEAAAAGTITEAHLATVVRWIIERPEFENSGSVDVSTLVEHGAARLAAAPSLEAILASLCERLPRESERLLAFGLATSVAHAGTPNGRKAPTQVLQALQAAFGINELVASHIRDVVARGGSISEALGEKVERLCAEAMVLMTAAEGEFGEEETREMVETLLSEPAFQHMSRTEAVRTLADAVEALVTEGLKARLAAMARGLSLRDHRRKAYALALTVARHGDGLSQEKEDLLALLQDALELRAGEIALLRAQ